MRPTWVNNGGIFGPPNRSHTNDAYDWLQREFGKPSTVESQQSEIDQLRAELLKSQEDAAE